MEVIMLKNNGICIKTKSKFEEEYLAPIITALEKKEFSVYPSTDDMGYGFVTISPKDKP